MGHSLCGVWWLLSITSKNCFLCGLSLLGAKWRVPSDKPIKWIASFGLSLIALGSLCLFFHSRCRIHGLAFEVTLFSPVVTILTLNVIVFCFAVRHLNQSRKMSKNAIKGPGLKQSQASAMKKALLESLTMASLLGLTWITGLFMFDNASLPVQYLFTVAISLQGLFVFLLQCVAKPDVRRQWSFLFRQSKRHPRNSSNVETGSVMTSVRSISISSENTLVNSGPKRTLSAQTCSQKSTVKSPTSSLSCEVFENGTIQEANE